MAVITVVPRNIHIVHEVWTNTYKSHTEPAQGSNLTGPETHKMNNSSDIPHYDYIHIYATVAYVVIFLIGIIGNTVVVIVISKNLEMRTPTNWLLVNLSVADLLVLLFCMPPALVEFHAKDVWLLGPVMCKSHYVHLFGNNIAMSKPCNLVLCVLFCVFVLMVL